MSPEARRELVDLAERFCGGPLSDGDATRLNLLLRDDAEAQRLFLSVTTLHAGLLQEFAGESAWEQPDETRTRAHGPHARNWRTRRSSAPSTSV